MKRGTRRYTLQQRSKYLEMLDKVGLEWVDVFNGLVHDEETMRQTHFWDLFTGLWRRSKPLKTMDALALMGSVRSPQTRARHLAVAIENELVEQRDSPTDSRVKYVALTEKMSSRMDIFFDSAIRELLGTARQITDNGTASVTASAWGRTVAKAR